MKKTLSSKALLLLAVALAGVAIASSCKKDKENETVVEPTVGQTVAYADITDSIPCTILSMDSVTLVNDNATLQSLCNNAPTLDLTNHSLVIVSGVSTSGIESINTYLTTTDNVSYDLKIDVIKDMTTVVIGWRKYILIPKTISRDNITLEINYKTH